MTYPQDTITAANSRTSGFEACPVEVQNEIFSYLLPHYIPDNELPLELQGQPEPIWQTRPGFSGLFCVNRAISERALIYFYGKNNFVVNMFSEQGQAHFGFHSLDEKQHPSFRNSTQLGAIPTTNLVHIRNLQIKLAISWERQDTWDIPWNRNTHRGRSKIISQLWPQIVNTRTLLEQCPNLHHLGIKLEVGPKNYHHPYDSYGPGGKWFAVVVQNALKLLKTRPLPKIQLNPEDQRALDVVATTIDDMPPLAATAVLSDLPIKIQESIWRFMIPNNIVPGKLAKMAEQDPNTDTHLLYASSVPRLSTVGVDEIFARVMITNAYVAQCFVEKLEGRPRTFHLRYDQRDLDPSPSNQPCFPTVADFGCPYQMDAFDKMEFESETQGTPWAVQAATHTAIFLGQVNKKTSITIKYDSCDGVALPKSSADIHRVLHPLWDESTGVKGFKKVEITGSLITYTLDSKPFPTPNCSSQGSTVARYMTSKSTPHH